MFVYFGHWEIFCFSDVILVNVNPFKSWYVYLFFDRSQEIEYHGYQKKIEFEIRLLMEKDGMTFEPLQDFYEID